MSTLNVPYKALKLSGLMVPGVTAIKRNSMGVGEVTSPGSLGKTNSMVGESNAGTDLGLIPVSASLDCLISSGVTNSVSASAGMWLITKKRAEKTQSGAGT